MEETAGWWEDCQKNIPAFYAFFEHYPSKLIIKLLCIDADWFLMIDDDSYVFIDNLKADLAKLDPEEPHCNSVILY